ncbi:hypothetical protein AB0M43_35560 [Longispora sp. NPDC051575]|uniref:hypothetical protein n=1 Tax=Longispora sp. NPDC051575 TaxID=3154943 RepID=UPI003437E201
MTAPLATADVARWISRRPPGDVLVLSGAGVSMDPPTGLPSGVRLTERVADACLLPGTLARIREYHRRIGWTAEPPCGFAAPAPTGPTVGRVPRLETVLGVVARTVPDGDTIVRDLLADVSTAVPNHLHRMLMEHVAAGGGHLTANFDLAVERAAGLPNGHPSVLHFHGSLPAFGGGPPLGVTLNRIEAGFPPAVAARFTSALTSHRALLVVGYSGSDFFDVDVTVSQLPAGALAHVEVLWVGHGGHDGWHLLPDDGAPPLVGALRAAGAKVRVVCGRTVELLAECATAWGLRRWGLDPTPGPPSAPLVDLPRNQRATATFELYRELGLTPEVDRMLTGGDTGDVTETDAWGAASEVAWEQGRYGSLLRAWWWRTPTGVPRARRAERIGACLWVQGRLLPAFLWLAWHLRRRDLAVEDRRLLMETLGRVVEHMTRTPDLRPLGRWLAPRVVLAVRELGGVDQSAGVHNYRRRSDLVSSLDGQPRTDEARVAESWFTQAGSLLAALNYRHRSLRDGYLPDVATAILDGRYREQIRLYRQIGSLAGVRRARLLPGSPRVFTLSEFADTVFGLQFGWWHRVRLLVHFAVGRVRQRAHLSENRTSR